MRKAASDEGAHKAAIFLMSVSSEDAAKLLKFLGPKEVHKLGVSMAALENVDNKTVTQIYSEFIVEAESKTSIGLNKDEQIRKVFVTALGEDKANNVIDKILIGGNTKGLDSLKWMDAKAIADIIRDEHPQIQAIILSYLDPDHAAEVLNSLDEKVRIDLVMRISMQDSIQPAAIDELNSVMEKQVSNIIMNQTKTIGGIKRAADILNFVSGDVETTILGAVKERDEELANQIQDLMFIFDNIKSIDDRGIQMLLREVKTDTLVIALKAADNEIKDKIFKNMSKRAGELLKDDLEVKGPVRISEVEAAQKEILMIAKSLADQGKIMMGNKSEEMV
ncbi:flagellar motor switch protein FliG [Candidatus Berkiella aquae]|uniref:Flagellar motor switch protein FliG n=1 Tax=Candidatus Berkiella aquae TaxID=295108 RepID=A0A0Q9YLA1_9GAMM|nr:flagellar motor switch protein FliG [Candidatus Berkiella aquae]MCS5711425.1 flagellar motor switch protein FliG [Candidatus Berkiella aquae]